MAPREKVRALYLGSGALIALALCPCLRASFPEPDVVIFGTLTGTAPSSITAVWPAGSATAVSVPVGFYRIDVPLDFPKPGGGGRPGTARIGDPVELRVAGGLTVGIRIESPGQVLRYDVMGGAVGDVFRRADPNSDGRVDIGDAIFTLSFLFSGGRLPECFDAADSDDNGRLELTDPILTLGFLFLGGRPPPAPGAVNCGLDPTPDQFGRCFQPSCGEVGGGVGAGAEAGGGTLRGQSPPAAIVASQAPAGAGDLQTAGAGAARAEVPVAEAGAQAGDAAHALRDLDVSPAALSFGDVAVGESALKTLVLRNRGGMELSLEGIHSESADFAPLGGPRRIPPGAEAQLAVRFRPSAEGSRDSTLRFAPGLSIRALGRGSSSAPLARIADVLVAPASWTPSQEFLVPLEVDGLTPGSVLRIEVDQPGGLSIRGIVCDPHDAGQPEIGDDAVAGGGEPPAPGVYSTAISLGLKESSFRAFLACAPSAGSSQAAASFPLRWRSVHALIPGVLMTQALSAADGEVVVSDSSLDLDRDGVLSWAADCVYVERRRAGASLDSQSLVPPRFAPLLSAGEEEIARGCSRLEMEAGLLSGASSLLGDSELLRWQLLGAEPPLQLPGDAALRLAHLAKAYLAPRRLAAADEEAGGAVVVLQLVPASPEAAAVEVFTPVDISAVTIGIEIDGEADVEVEEAAAGFEAFVGRERGHPGRLCAAFLDRVGDAWLPAGRTTLARLSFRGSGALTVRMALGAAARGPLPLPGACRGGPILLDLGDGRVPNPGCDPNGDGVLDARDLVLFAEVLLGAKSKPAAAAACDVDRDGKLEFDDLFAVGREFLGRPK
jgi:hypothetical protein